MQIARDLGGVISGEHGIGITKLEFLTDEETSGFRRYKNAIDPEGRFNKGKLMPGADMSNAYTPSFGLMGHESLIMQQSDIASIADAIKDCLRCGKCKPVCTTHVPRANLLYSPRDKILATSLADRSVPVRRANAARHFDQALGRVFGRRRSLHCVPQVRIAVPGRYRLRRCQSMAMRDLLRRMGKKKFNAGAWASMFFLNATNPQTIKVVRTVMIEWGFKLQRFGNQFFRPAAALQVRHPPSTTGGRPKMTEQVVHFINKKMPGNLPKKTARALLDIEDSRYVPIIRDPQKTTQRNRSGVLLSRLRLRAAVLAGWAGDAGDAMARRRADGAAARATCAAAIRSAAPGSSTKPRKSLPTIASCFIALPTR